MDGTVQLDYQDAAERMLRVLAFFAEEAARQSKEVKPVPAPDLVLHMFDPEVRGDWKHETARRRVREAAEVARKLLRERGQEPLAQCKGCGHRLAPEATECPRCGSCGPRTGGPPPTTKRVGLVADGRGYWLAVDPGTLRWYADRRALAGKKNMAAAGHAHRTAQANAQPGLFGGGAR